MVDTISTGLAEAVLERLGLRQRPALSADGLGALYGAWCKRVPFDNIHKRIHFHGGCAEPLPGDEAERFFASYLRHGAGGTCWPTSEALHALTKTLGYQVRRASGSMLGTMDQNFPNHGTLLVEVDGGLYLADTSMLSEQPLRLVRGEASATADPVYGIVAEPLGALWKVLWKPGHCRDELECHLQHPEVSLDFYRTRYESTRRVSLFNASLYVRKNLPDGGILTIGRGHLIAIDRRGQVTLRPLGKDRDEVLVERFGISEELVARIPPDAQGDVFA